MWVGDYTIQPENGGLGVFTHEFTHDLGLPDLYDTSGNTGGAENSTGFWSLMSSGANIGNGSPKGIGDAPTDLGAWEQFQLGWLERAGRQRAVLRRGVRGREVPPRRSGRTTLRPTRRRRCSWCSRTSRCRWSSVTRAAGDKFFYSGSGDDLERHHDEDDRHHGRGAHRQGPLLHRGGLRLRLPRGLVRRWRHLDAGGDEPVRTGGRRPERLQRERRRHHR